MNEYEIKTYTHDTAKQREYWDTEFGFLEKFYENMLFCGEYVLENEEMAL